MAELLEAVVSWPSLVLVVVVFGFAPGFCLRLIVLAYPRSSPRRAELIAELYAVPRVQRPLWVAEQVEVALFEGLEQRVSAAIRRLTGRRRARTQTHERGVRLGPMLWAARKRRRHLALVTLIDELRRDIAILDGPEFAPSKETPRPRVYPRLPASATDAALTSGALAKRSDDVLLRLLHNWRDEVNGFNQRIELTEIRIFTSGIPAEVAEFERVLHYSDGYLNQVRHHLRELQGRAELYAVPRIQRPTIRRLTDLRRARTRGHRHLALVILMDELRRDIAILDGPEFAPSKETPRPRVYPRLPASATDAALTSGALAKRSDDVLLRLLHNWRDEVNGFNRRLELTEIQTFTFGNPAVAAEFERVLHSDGYLNQIRGHLRDLQYYLAVNYQQITSERHNKFGGSGGVGGE